MGKTNDLKYKRDLKNAQHFAFIQAFITAVQTAGFTATRITGKLAELVTAFGEEDRWYMIVRASDIVAQREAADQKRDRFYTRLHRLVQAWAGSGMEGLDAAATALSGPFNLYKVKVNAQMDEETGVLENLITDLSTTEMQAHITTINGTYLFEQMVEGQNQVKTLRLEQGVEESQKVYGALASARKACDGLYDELADLIESFSKVADDPTIYETFIRQWNGTVKLYQDMLDRKQSSSSGSGSGSGSGSSQGGGSDEGGSGSGSGSSGSGSGGSGSSGSGSSGSGSGSGTGSGGGMGTITPGGGGSGSGSGSGGSQSETVAAPSINGNTSFAESTQVTISGPEGAEIRYTTDGSVPTASSSLYSEAFSLSATTTVKAIAIKNGVSSEVTSKTFTKSSGGDDSE